MCAAITGQAQVTRRVACDQIGVLVPWDHPKTPATCHSYTTAVLKTIRIRMNFRDTEGVCSCCTCYSHYGRENQTTSVGTADACAYERKTKHDRRNRGVKNAENDRYIERSWE